MRNCSQLSTTNRISLKLVRKLEDCSREIAWDLSKCRLKIRKSLKEFFYQFLTSHDSTDYWNMSSGISKRKRKENENEGTMPNATAEGGSVKNSRYSSNFSPLSLTYTTCPNYRYIKKFGFH